MNVNAATPRPLILIDVANTGCGLSACAAGRSSARRGYTPWQRCIADVERVQTELKASGLDDVSCQHILTVQCALLDEVVKGRGVEDEACLQWADIPLQGAFSGTMDAGDTLCERMRRSLRDPAPDLAVVTCFQRVMLLGLLAAFAPSTTRRRLPAGQRPQ